MKILSAREMRELDERMMGEYGISQEVLMEYAPKAAFSSAQIGYIYSTPAWAAVTLWGLLVLAIWVSI